VSSKDIRKRKHQSGPLDRHTTCNLVYCLSRYDFLSATCMVEPAMLSQSLLPDTKTAWYLPTHHQHFHRQYMALHSSGARGEWDIGRHHSLPITKATTQHRDASYGYSMASPPGIRLSLWLSWWHSAVHGMVRSHLVFCSFSCSAIRSLVLNEMTQRSHSANITRRSTDATERSSSF